MDRTKWKKEIQNYSGDSSEREKSEKNILIRGNLYKIKLHVCLNPR